MRTTKAAKLAAEKYTLAAVEEKPVVTLNSRFEDLDARVEAAQEARRTQYNKQKPVVPKVDPMVALREVLGEVDEIVDEVFLRKVTPKFNMLQWLKDQSFMNEDLVEYIKDFYGQTREEVQMALDKTDEQLVEGYAYLNPAQKRKVLEFYDTLLGNCDEYLNLTKRRKALNRKPRVKKPLSAQKQVKSFKYLTESDEYSLISIQPENIVGASQLWTFNTANKKLTHYIAADRGGIQVKGCAFMNWDQKLTVCKSLRKPTETLKIVLDGGKIERKKLMTSLTTKATPATGRSNTKTVIVKFEK